MAITMENIKSLRERTGCGISDCKSALEESAGDIEKASEILRKKGVAKAAKRADRETSEGVILASVNENNNEGYMLEINSETDFVSRNEKFQGFANKIFDVVKNIKPADLDALLNSEMEGSTVKEQLETLSGTIGEKLEISNIAVLKNENGVVANYIHGNGRIGILVSLNGGTPELARDIAMQVAAANPKYLTPEEVPVEETNKEKDIYREQLKNEGKPENIIENILTGKINKYFQEICLTKQVYIKDDKMTVEQILGDVKINEFVRFSL